MRESIQGEFPEPKEPQNSQQAVEKERVEPFYVDARVKITPESIQELFFLQRHDAYPRFLRSLNANAETNSRGTEFKSSPLVKSILQAISEVHPEIIDAAERLDIIEQEIIPFKRCYSAGTFSFPGLEGNKETDQALYFPINPEERERFFRKGRFDQALLDAALRMPYDQDEFALKYAELTDEKRKILQKYSFTAEAMVPGKDSASLSRDERIAQLIRTSRDSDLHQAYCILIQGDSGEESYEFHPHHENDGVEINF